MKELEKKVFTQNEETDLSLVRKIRHDIINHYTEDGTVPSSGYDVDRLIAVSNDLETGTLNIAKVRIKQQEADTNDASSAILSKLLYAMENDDGEMAIDAEVTEIDETEINAYTLPSHLEEDTVEGELVQGPTENLHEIIFGDDDSVDTAPIDRRREG